MLQSNLSNEKYSTRFKKVYFPLNIDDMIRYEQVLETQYTAVNDGETVVILAELIGARVVQIEREIKPMAMTDFGFNVNLGRINLLNGVALSAGESLFILYSKLITS